jgi:protocatechuate 3,4-dioxygenase beta subunit
VRRPLRLLVGLAVVAAFAVQSVPAPASPLAQRCRPTPTDGFGPFGRGTPPQRAKIGTGHVLTGVVLSSLDCRPILRARVELWQAGRNGEYTRASSATVFTDRSGRFRFEGPFPTAYGGGPPHIHMRILARGHEQLLTRYEPPRGSRRGSVRLILRPALV